MQENNNKNEKISYLKDKIGLVFREIRNPKISLNRLALECDIDKSTLSKIERGIYDCRISTAIKVCEAHNIKFSDYAKLLEKELGENFTFSEL